MDISIVNNMEQNFKNELFDAIKNGRLEHKDMGDFPSAHSQPFFYKTLNGDNFVLLRSKDKSFIDGYKKQQILYPFLQKQNLPVRTASKLDILEYGNEVFAIMERFFGHGHNSEKFAKATKEQKTKFVVQVATFFYKLHSIPIEILPKGLDYTPYFKYDRNTSKNKEVFLHADFNYSNFLVDDDYNLYSVFDWHPACIGPRIAEFAAFVYCKDLNFLSLVLEQYNKLAGTSITPEQVILHEKERR